MRRNAVLLTTLAWMSCLPGCLPGCHNAVREDLSYDYDVVQTWSVEELPYQEIVQFDSVAWAPEQSSELRRLITEDNLASGRAVLEIRTGTGLLSLLCAQNGANKVVATDVNPAAVACARYNVARMALDSVITVQQAQAQPPDAFATLAAADRFDLILSQPPSLDQAVSEPSQHALHDPGFGLLASLLGGLDAHLRPSGRCLICYGNVAAIKRAQTLAAQQGLVLKILDDRDLDTLPPDFLPSMLLEIKLPPKPLK